MDLFVDRTDRRALSVQLYEQVRDAIADGRLLAGDPMVPSRQLAHDLGVARHTVTTAYGRLTAEGFLVGRAGGGSVVATTAPPPSRRLRRAVALAPTPRLGGWVARPSIDESSVRYDMRPGRPDPALFPFDPWRRAVARAAASPVPDAERVVGLPTLRRAIAQWVARTRSIVADEQMIVVTTGSQHAIDAVCRVTLAPGDVIAVEDPGFVHLRPLFHALGVRVVPVEVDGEGLIVDCIPKGARLVFVTPSHQYPLGLTMSIERRRALLAWAARNRAAIIEDDFESEFRYADRPFEPLQRLDDHGHVIYVGSFWKTMSPAVRVGFAVVPTSLIEPVGALLDATDCVPSPTIQLALSRMIDSGELDRHLRRAKRIYQARHRVLLDSLDAAVGGSLAGLLTVMPSYSGLHLTAGLAVPADEGAVIRDALRRGVAISGLSRHYHDAHRDGNDHGSTRRNAPSGLVMGFGAIAEDELPAAIDIVAATIADVALSTPQCS